MIQFILVMEYHCRLVCPQNLIISGASQQGKTYLTCQSILRHKDLFLEPLSAVYLFHRHYQPLYEMLKNQLDIPLYIYSEPPEPDFRPIPNSLVVFDDYIELDNEVIRSFFIRKSHHYRCSCWYLLQNIFSKNKTMRDITLNAQQIVLFNPKRDQGQLDRLNYQLLGGKNAGFLPTLFKRMEDRKHAYLLIDLAEECPRQFRFRSTLVPGNDTLVFQPQK